MSGTEHPAGASDFDFLLGKWHVKNIRLKSRLTGCDEWEEFDAHYENWPLLEGFGNGDRMRVHWRGRDYEGCSLRIFNPADGLWRIYWVDNVNFRLGPPVVGGFTDGIGEFYGDDIHEGTPVKVRFTWSDISSDSARWEQAFSADDGDTWETNWIMISTRVKVEEEAEVDV
jgi:hypothetical protein